MDSSRRSEPQQFKSITVLRHPVFLGSKPQENGVLGLRRACPTRLANEDGTHRLIVGKDAALITYKATVDGTCGGQQLPTNSRAAAIYVRDDGKWKRAFHARAAIVDPKGTLAKSVDRQHALNEDNAQPTNRNARTDAMLAVERNVWEAWRAHDAKKLADLTARDISFINIFGVYLATKTDAMQDLSGTYCDVKSISLTDAAGTMLSPMVGILTFKARADGTCYGQKVGPVWGSSVYVKHGDVWKWTFGINLPARREGT
jgi:ketosteroid isomerase-like protein